MFEGLDPNSALPILDHKNGKLLSMYFADFSTAPLLFSANGWSCTHCCSTVWGVPDPIMVMVKLVWNVPTSLHRPAKLETFLSFLSSFANSLFELDSLHLESCRYTLNAYVLELIKTLCIHKLKCSWGLKKWHMSVITAGCRRVIVSVVVKAPIPQSVVEMIVLSHFIVTSSCAAASWGLRPVLLLGNDSVC